jgi:hypothetical protein
MAPRDHGDHAANPSGGREAVVDFAGDTLPVFDGLTGQVRAAKIFVALLGAWNYTFAQARFGEALPDRTRCDLPPRRNGVARGWTEDCSARTRLPAASAHVRFVLE